MSFLDRLDDRAFDFEFKSYSGEHFEGVIVNLRDEVDFNDDNIDEQLQSHTKRLFALNRAYDAAIHYLANLKDAKIIKENSLYQEFKDRKGSDGKLMSDSRVERLITLNKDLQLIAKELRDCESYCKSLKSIIDNFSDGLKAMQTYASNRRKEINGLSYTT